MSNEITSEQIRAMAEKLLAIGVTMMDVKHAADMLIALAAEREQSPAVGHAAMVAKLRKLQAATDPNNAYFGGAIVKSIDAILSTEPADPVDAAIRSANGAEGVE